MARRRLLALVLAGCASGAAACATGATFDGHVYRDQAVAFELREVPSGYRRIDVGKASLAFRDDANNASVVISGRCEGASDAPLTALTNHLLFGLTEREFLKEETIPFDGREARHTIVKAKLDGVFVMTSIFVLKKNGCIYDFVHAAPPARFEAGEASFTQLVAGFHTLATASDKPGGGP